MENNTALTQHQLKQMIQEFGFEHFGFVSIGQPRSLGRYAQWIEAQYHGEMAYLKDHLPLKQNLNALLPEARTIISIGYTYVPSPHPADLPIKKLKIARYARQNEDYHYWFTKKLNELSQKLKTLFPKEKFLCFTDSYPILERDWAWQAGLGWFGKNSCLIHPKKGSFFLLGEVVTTLHFDIKNDFQPLPDMCGTCSRCIQVCPTNAILENRTLDAKKCISYWTIENKNNPPETLRKNFEGWFFGCDICQTVCPWNEKVFSKPEMNDNLNVDDPHERKKLVQEIQWILMTSNKKLNKIYKNSPLSRAGGHGLKKNTLLIIAHYQLTELLPFLETFQFERENLQELKTWVIEQLGFREMGN